MTSALQQQKTQELASTIALAEVERDKDRLKRKLVELESATDDGVGAAEMGTTGIEVQKDLEEKLREAEEKARRQKERMKADFLRIEREGRELQERAEMKTEQWASKCWENMRSVQVSVFNIYGIGWTICTFHPLLVSPLVFHPTYCVFVSPTFVLFLFIFFVNCILFV